MSLSLDEFSEIYRSSGEVAAHLVFNDLDHQTVAHVQFLIRHPELAPLWPLEWYDMDGIRYLLQNIPEMITRVSWKELSPWLQCVAGSSNLEVMPYCDYLSFASSQWYIVLCDQPEALDLYYPHIFEQMFICDWSSLCDIHPSFKDWLNLDIMTYEDWDSFCEHEPHVYHPKRLDMLDRHSYMPMTARRKIKARADKRWKA
jgi:hypothetical protein